MAVIKNIIVRCGADFSALTKASTKAKRDLHGLKTAGSTVRRTLGSLGITVGAAAVIGFGKSCASAASDLQEVQNVVDVTFGSMNERVNRFARDAITQDGAQTRCVTGRLRRLSLQRGVASRGGVQARCRDALSGAGRGACAPWVWYNTRPIYGYSPLGRMNTPAEGAFCFYGKAS